MVHLRFRVPSDEVTPRLNAKIRALTKLHPRVLMVYNTKSRLLEPLFRVWHMEFESQDRADVFVTQLLEKFPMASVIQ